MGLIICSLDLPHPEDGNKKECQPSREDTPLKKVYDYYIIPHNSNLLSARMWQMYTKKREHDLCPLCALSLLALSDNTEQTTEAPRTQRCVNALIVRIFLSTFKHPSLMSAPLLQVSEAYIHSHSSSISVWKVLQKYINFLSEAINWYF